MKRTWQYGFTSGRWKRRHIAKNKGDIARANLLCDRSIAVRLSVKVQAGVPRNRKGRTVVDKEIRDLALCSPELIKAKRSQLLFQKTIKERS